MKKRKIDCVLMVRKIRDGIYLKTKDMSQDELIEFYSKESKPEGSKKEVPKRKAA